MRTSPLLMPALLALGTLSPAHAEPHTHDGFLLRLSIGFGYENLGLEDGLGTTLDVGGFGAGTSIGIGGVVAPNLAINADLFAAAVVSPNVEQNGVELGKAQDTSVTLSALGVGATYYFMPINIYVALSLGFAVTSITVEGSDFESDAGFALNAMVGKEFWVGREWGIGVAGQLIYADVPTETDSSSASFISANIMFSATFN